MEFILDSIERLIYIYEEIFWLKECLTVFNSILVFALVKWMLRISYREVLFLYLGTFIGVACIFFGDIGYLSDNDVLKLLAPTCFYLLIYNKNGSNDTILFAFLIPYFITSFEFYRNFYIAMESIGSHLAVIFFIMLVKENLYLSLFISVVIGLLINLIGVNSPPGTNDILLNPALITLSAKGLEFYTKNTRYTEFLKSFWATLLCFAYFGSWIFHCIKPICPLGYNLK